MSQFTRKDQMLLSEAYSTQLLKESFPGMTLSQVSNNLDLLSESEAEWVVTFSERVLNEFFGGLRALTGGAKQDAGRTGGAISGALGRAGNAVKGAAQQAGNAVKGAAQQVGGGIKNAAQQVGNNVKDIYNSGEANSGAQSFAKKAQQYVTALQDELQKAQQSGMITFKGDINQIPLGDIVDELMVSAQGHQNLSNSAQRRGVLGGAGGAFKQGMQSQG